MDTYTGHTTAQCEQGQHDFQFPVDSYGVPMTTARYCSNCDTIESGPIMTTTGYTNCEACDEPSMGALCEWCRLGALENNCDPDSISSPDFDTQLLGIWRASGEAIAEREDHDATNATKAS